MTYYRWLAECVRALYLVPLLDLIYKPFARWRLDRRADSCPIFFILLAVVVSFALSAYL